MQSWWYKATHEGLWKASNKVNTNKVASLKINIFVPNMKIIAQFSQVSISLKHWHPLLKRWKCKTENFGEERGQNHAENVKDQVPSLSGIWNLVCLTVARTVWH